MFKHFVRAVVLFGILATVSSAAALPDYLVSLDSDTLLAAAQLDQLQLIRVVIIDSGINCTSPGFGPKVNRALSKSWVDDSPCTDQYGHGTNVTSVFWSIAPLANIEFVSFKVCKSVSVATEDCSAFGEALSALPSLNDGTPTIVNLSIAEKNSPPLTSGSVLQLMQSHPEIFFSMAAGNDGLPQADYPGYYGSLLANGICLTSFAFRTTATDTAGWISPWANWGPETEMAGVGAVPLPGFGPGTSWVAPQAAALAALLWTIQPSLNPALIKRLILAGGMYVPTLYYYVGATSSPFAAETLNGAGALRELAKLQSLEIHGSSPIEIYPNDRVTLSLNVNANDIATFAANPGIELMDEQGNFLGSSFGVIENDSLQFAAPGIPGNYQVGISLAGMPVGNKIPLAITPKLILRPPLLPDRPGTPIKRLPTPVTSSSSSSAQ